MTYPITGEYLANLPEPLQEIFRKLEDTCRSFDGHERAALKALNETLGIGKELIQANTLVRKSSFGPDDLRRYDKAYEEYKSHYSEEARQ